MQSPITRVLVVDDVEPWRAFVARTLQAQPDLQIIGEALDGLEAVHRAQKLQPDLILLDIGLPTLNGIEAAVRIRQLSPRSKILFLSENRSRDIAKEALRSGGSGYVLKSDAGSDLLRAVESVLKGKQFISASLAGHDLGDLTEYSAHNPHHHKLVAPIPLQNVEMARHHEAGFYFDDRALLDGVTQFIGAALKSENAAVVLATESHRNSLLSRLQTCGLDIGTIVEQGRYIALDAADTLSMFMVKGRPDPVLFMGAFGHLILGMTKAAKGEHPRVAVFGECVHLLWAQGNAEAAIEMEKLGNQLIKTHDVDILCGYSLGGLVGEMDSHTLQRIRAEHSAVHFR